jgi:hypothetical protein
MRPPYNQYEEEKLGHRKGALNRIVYMFEESFTSITFRKFWQNWNPLFSYYLLYFCYRPLNRILHRQAALVITFGISGLIHDVAASIALRRPFILFTFTFMCFGLFVVAEELLQVNLSKISRLFRPLYHLSLITGSYFLTKNIMDLISR